MGKFLRRTMHCPKLCALLIFGVALTVVSLDDSESELDSSHVIAGRRGGRSGLLSTVGTFKLSSNRAGNDELEDQDSGELEYNLGSSEMNNKPTNKPTERPDDSASDSTAWLGSYNYLKAEETPQSNGAAITGGSTEGCETQKTCSTYNSANGHTCTSCKDGYAFRLQSHGQKMGNCQSWGATQAGSQHCTVLNSTAMVTYPGNRNVICTKIQLTNNIIWLNKAGTPATVATELASVKGSSGAAVAHCRIWKQNYCQPDSSGDTNCKVKKNVICHKICKVDTWWAGNTAPHSLWGTECSTALCKTESGTKYACQEVAMTA